MMIGCDGKIINKSIVECKLDGGTILKYDAMGGAEDTYDPDIFECIGHGVIYSYNGVLQEGKMFGYFFLRYI